MFTTYIIKVFICSAVVYTYYTLALKNNNIHHWNRYYLLYGSLLSLVLPLMHISIPAAASPEQTYTTQLIQLRETIINSGNHAYSFSSMWLVLYTLISTALIVKIIINILNIHRLVKRNPVDERTGLIMAETSAFSFFNNIFWPGDIAPDSKEGQQILRHELAHVTGKHTIDKLIMEVICSVCWINPLFFLLKKELSMVHEFIADKAAADEDTSDYARTILMMTLHSRSLPVANNFSEAPVKRRILMLFNNNSNNTFMKKTIVLPLVIGLVAVISCRQEQTQTAKPGTEPQVEVIKMEPIAPDDQVYTFVSDPPKFKGGEEKLSEYLIANLKYPEEAIKQKTTGTVFVQFIVKSDGHITDVKTVGKAKGNGLEEEAIRVVKTMPAWEPGAQDGKKVSVQFNLPIRYTLE